MAISAKLKKNLVSLNAETIYYMSLSKNSLMGCEKIQKIKVISLLCYFKVNQKHQMQNSSFQLWDCGLVLGLFLIGQPKNIRQETQDKDLLILPPKYNLKRKHLNCCLCINCTTGAAEDVHRLGLILLQ